MAFPKPQIFDSNEQIVSAYCRALGHPARIRILMLLYERGKLNVCDLHRVIPLHSATISAHLRKLRLAGLIDVEVRGMYNDYYLAGSTISRAQNAVNDYFMRLMAGET